MKGRDRRDLVWMLLVSAAALVLAFATPLIPAYKMLRYGAFYGCLTGLVVLLVLLVSYWIRKPRPAEMEKAGKRIPVPIFLLLGGYAVLVGLVPNAFRVMDDEGVLLNTALSLYEERELFAASKGYWIDGEFEILEGALDKRPFLYPFLLSLVHQVFGYRVENAFLLNALFGGLALILVYRLLAGWFGTIPAALAAFGLASTPLFLTSANGAGFEMLNFLLLAGMAVMVREFIAAPNERAAVLLCGVAVSLAYARYESVLFVLPVGILLLVERIRRPGFRFHWAMYVVPFLLVPYVWLFRCTLARQGAWARAEAEERTVFGLEYVGENLADALRFFFTIRERAANDPIFIYLGVAGIAAFGIAYLLRKRKRASAGDCMFRDNVFFWGSAYALLAGVLSTYFWSSFMDPMSQRMGLPFFLIPAFGSAYLLSRLGSRARDARRLLWALIALLVVGRTFWTTEAVDRTWRSNPLATLQTEKLNWFRDRGIDPATTLFVDNNSSVWTALRAPAVHWGRVPRRIPQIAYHLQLGTFDSIYCMQVQNYDSEREVWRAAEKHVVETFQLSSIPVATFGVNAVSRVEILRLQDLAGVEETSLQAGDSDDSSWVLQLP